MLDGADQPARDGVPSIGTPLMTKVGSRNVLPDGTTTMIPPEGIEDEFIDAEATEVPVSGHGMLLPSPEPDWWGGVPVQSSCPPARKPRGWAYE